MKKKIVYVLLTALLLNVATPVAAATKISDVPVDHWAYHAVNTVVSRGYLTMFEDGTFQGTRGVDRYSLANVIARLLDDIEVSRVRGTSGDLGEINDLRLRFEEDLATWYADQQNLRESLQQIDENAIVAEERVSRVVTAQVTLQEDVESIRNQVLAIQAEVGGVEGLIGEHAGDLSESDRRLGELLNAVIQLEREIILQAEAIDSLENWAGEKGAVFATLQSADSQIETDLEQLSNLNQQLERDLHNIAVMLQREVQKREELATGLETAQADLLVLRDDRSMLEDLRAELGTDVNAQINAALIREQRLERQIKTLEEEFETYRESTQQEVKSAKTLGTIGIALGAIGAIIGVMSMSGIGN